MTAVFFKRRGRKKGKVRKWKYPSLLPLFSFYPPVVLFCTLRSTKLGVKPFSLYVNVLLLLLLFYTSSLFSLTLHLPFPFSGSPPFSLRFRP